MSTAIPSCVLDASALLALLQGEPGAEVVKTLLEDAVVSSVNWSEVAQKSLDRGVKLDGLRGDLETLGMIVAPFTAEEAEATARLRGSTSALGLSLSDRACLSLSRRLGVPALTTDRAWLELGVETAPVRVIR